MLRQFLIDLYIITALTTVTIMLVSKGILWANHKFKVCQWFQQAAMMLCMWIKSCIKADKASYSKWRHKWTYHQCTQSQYCRQYYIYGNKKRSAQIVTKTANTVSSHNRLHAMHNMT
jgi:hypothetical protein